MDGEIVETEYSDKECIRCGEEIEADSFGLDEGYCCSCWYEHEKQRIGEDD